MAFVSDTLILWMDMTLVTMQVKLVNVSIHTITAKHIYMPSYQKALPK